MIKVKWKALVPVTLIETQQLRVEGASDSENRLRFSFLKNLSSMKLIFFLHSKGNILPILKQLLWGFELFLKCRTLNFCLSQNEIRQKYILRSVIFVRQRNPSGTFIRKVVNPVSEGHKGVSDREGVTQPRVWLGHFSALLSWEQVTIF